MNKFLKVSSMIIFIGYMLILSRLILIKHYAVDNLLDKLLFREKTPFFLEQYNLIPFHTIIAYFNVEGTTLISAIENLAGNVIGFIPLGFLLPIISKEQNTIFKVIFTTFSISLTYELLQRIFRLGIFDVDDLIMNTLGGVFGYIIFLGLFRLLKNKRFSY